MSAVSFEEHSKVINSGWLTYLHSLRRAAAGRNSCFPCLLAAGNAHCSLKVLFRDIEMGEREREKKNKKGDGTFKSNVKLLLLFLEGARRGTGL